MNTPKQKVRVALVEANPLFLEGFLHTFTTNNSFDVTDYGTSARGVFQRMNGTPPDVLISNLESLDWDVMELLQNVRSKYNGMKLIVNDRVNSVPIVKMLLKAGISTYFVKDSVTQAQLMRIVLSTHQMGYCTTTIVSEKLLEEVKLEATRQVELTERELDILRYTRDGFNRKEISKQLFITEATVKFHLDKLRDRYECKSVLQLVVWSIRNGLIKVQ